MPSEAKELLERLRSEQTPDPERVVSNAASVAQATEDFVGSGIRQFIDNALAIPSATGDLLALTAAGIQTGAESVGNLAGLTDVQGSLSERFGANVEEQQGLFPASALRAIPRPTAEEFGAGLSAAELGVQNLLRGEAPNLAGEFRENLPLQEAVRARQQGTTAGQLGEIGGDVATIMTGRAPLARARVPRARQAREAAESRAKKADIPESVRGQTRDVLSDRIVPFFEKSGLILKRGAGRVTEASIEGLTLALLNDQDPMSSAMLAAGAQGAGSLGLFLAERPVKRLLPAIATAAVVTQMFKAVAPGERNIFESFDFAVDKSIFAIALGTFGALAGSGRLRGPAAEKFPALFDAMTAVPRAAVQNRLRELTESAENGDELPLKVLERMASNPEFFGEDQLRSLDRALQSDKAGAFTQEIDRLRRESESFQDIIDDI